MTIFIQFNTKEKKIMLGMLEVLLCHIALDIFGLENVFPFVGAICII